MSQVTVKISLDNTEHVKNATKEAIGAALEAAGLQAEKHTKENLSKPVPHRMPRSNADSSTIYPITDTGNLMNGITHAVEGDACYVGAAVDYASFVELGTSKSRPYPYLKPAIVDNIKEYESIIRDTLVNLIDI